jgi:hypothetical protein
VEQSILISLTLISQAFAVLRPLFPVKAAPPFSGETIVIGDDLVWGSAKEAPGYNRELVTVLDVRGNASLNGYLDPVLVNGFVPTIGQSFTLNRDGVDLVIHELVGDVIMIGRAPLNHIVIDHPTVSAQHAILARVADSYQLKDLHSTNGIQINGVSITDAELKDGDKIRFGSVVAIFVGCRRKG